MAPSTQSESHFEDSTEAPRQPGALLVFSGTTPQLRAIPLVRNAPQIFGRENTGGAALPDDQVSKQHCELSFDGAIFHVRDLGSKNGVSVQGVAHKQPVHAAAGSVLQMGKTLFLLLADVRPFAAATVTTGDRVIGPSYRAALDQIALGARTGAAVLITGENGSGKELAARTFHEAAAKSGPYVALNSAELKDTLAESLLFGAVKGSYSDAKDTKGHFREAHNGVLFLDELGELDLKVQAKLLRAVEHKEVMPVGGNSYIPVNVRLVCATNRDLALMVEEGTFRQDLYYRLNQHPVRLPPLRDRLEEIPWLIQHTLGGELPAHVSLVEACLRKPWPGNVRELVSAVKKAAANARAQGANAVRSLHLDSRAGDPTSVHIPVKVSLPRGADQTLPASPAAPPMALSSEEVVAALKANAWNVAATARALGYHRTQLVRLMKKHGIEAAGAEEEEAG